jgi:hypothetical protein
MIAGWNFRFSRLIPPDAPGRAILAALAAAEAGMAQATGENGITQSLQRANRILSFGWVSFRFFDKACETADVRVRVTLSALRFFAETQCKRGSIE